MKINSLLAFATLIVMTSCTGLTQVTVPQSSINLNNTEIETARKVSYTLRKTYVFGIGGMSARARNTNIVDELMKKANLQTNEVLSYITISRNINIDCLGIVVISKHTATGYVVRPKDGIYKEETLDITSDKKTRMESKGGMKEVMKIHDMISRAKSVEGLQKVAEVINAKCSDGAISENDRSRLLKKIQYKISTL